MTEISTRFSIITSFFTFNFPTKTHRLTNWIKKQDPSCCYLQDIPLMTDDTHHYKIKRWKKVLQANESRNEQV